MGTTEKQQLKIKMSKSGNKTLTHQQRQIASKISEIELERKEHDLVIDTLKDLDEDRKCFRLIGDVLVERTVGEFLPALINNQAQQVKAVSTLTTQLEQKGREIVKYKQEHNLTFKGEEEKKSEENDKVDGNTNS